MLLIPKVQWIWNKKLKRDNKANKWAFSNYSLKKVNHSQGLLSNFRIADQMKINSKTGLT